MGSHVDDDLDYPVPFTPFHFGPGLLLKGVAPRHVSASAFVAANVAIDLESLYNLARGAWPIHTRLHTFVGAALAGITTVLALLALRWAALRVLRVRTWLAATASICAAEVSVRGIVMGAMAGALTHPLLDGLMHQDIEPFGPWTSENPLRGLISLWSLHLGCAIAGAIGTFLCVARWRGGRTRAGDRT